MLVKANVASTKAACYKQAMSELRDAIKEYFRKNAVRGGKARAAKLSASRRSEIARKAGKQRWRNHNGTKRPKS